MSTPRIYSPENPPAFPYAFEHQDAGGVNLGMSLRDWFAGQALSVVTAPFQTGQACYDPGIIAGWAYQLADAMLTARAATCAGKTVSTD